MYLPPLQPVSNSKIRICGDVTIHPTASIAPGVIIQAAPESSIVIEAEVCIGMGSIINAYQGSIKLERGAILGPGALVIGSGTIGTNACIGSATTIFNTSVSPMAVIVSGSLIGDESRQLIIESQTTQPSPNNGATANSTSHLSNSSVVEEETIQESSKFSQKNPSTEQQEKTENSAWNSEPIDSNQTKTPKQNLESETNSESTQKEPSKNSKTENNSLETEPQKNYVAGKVYFNELLLTLFPHNKNSNNNSQRKE